MVLNFCTLFDSNYSAKGLVMYRSLLKYCNHFHLYIFAFDEAVMRVLDSMNLEHVTVISLTQFEDQSLLSIKETRSKAEYCWTCTSSTVLYILKHYNLSHCTYLDADLCFFSNPKVLIDEMGDNDVLITSHRYSKEYDYSSECGKYCVQFMTFKNTENGLKILNWWRNACLEWCYARGEDGKFGDQKYLDDWPIRFEGIYELQHLGGGVAPWNMQQYFFSKNKGKWLGKVLSTGMSFELVFFHFHAVSAFKKNFLREFHFEDYTLPSSIRECIYLPYISNLLKQNKKLKKIDRSIDGMATKKISLSWFNYLKVIRRRVLKNDNRYFYLICRL